MAVKKSTVIQSCAICGKKYKVPIIIGCIKIHGKIIHQFKTIENKEWDHPHSNYIRE